VSTKPAAATTGTLAERIEQLFQTVHPGRPKPYSLRDVVDEINAAAGGQVISHGYLWQLRKGRKTNPSITQIAALAAFFGVPPSYFFDVPGEEPLDPATRLALSDDAVRDIILRAHGLPPTVLRTIQEMTDSARALAGLPPVSNPSDSPEDPG
jgi:transcriptional regulator with XRE-family HTH domain